MRQNTFNKTVNHDGKYNDDESTAMAANGSGRTTVDDLVSEFDSDGVGAMSEREFNATQEQQTQGAGGPPPLPAGNISSEDFAEQLFADSDTDEDRSVSKREFTHGVGLLDQSVPRKNNALDGWPCNDRVMR
jgi:hypothetical protein